MKKALIVIPDVEHTGDIDRYRSLIIDVGGNIIETRWSGEDGDDAYIAFECRDDEHAKKIKEKIENE